MNQNSDYLMELAERYMKFGQTHQAIEELKSLLGADPDHAEAHSLLALCLKDTKRLGAALHEARLGLSLDPDSALCNLALGYVMLAKNELKEASDAFSRVHALDPEDTSAHIGAALVAELQGDKARWKALIDEALELEPEDTEILVEHADYWLKSRKPEKANKFVMDALQINPESVDALCKKGEIDLFAGNLESAEEHIVAALRLDPENETTLRQFVNLKTRKNWFLGVFWKFNSMFIGRSMVQVVLILLFLYLGYRVGDLMLMDAGYESAANYLTWVWLAFVAYTWIGPVIVYRLLAKELGRIDLDSNY